MTDVQATLLHSRGTAALVSRYIHELADQPRPASGPAEGPVRVIPNGQDGAAAAPS
jgi:hypothetical protein